MQPRARFLSFLAVLLCFAPGSSARADDVSPVEARLYLDTPTVAPGQNLAFRLAAYNPADHRVTITFTSGYVADYEIDGEYVWSDGKAFTLSLQSFDLPARSEVVLQEFIHDPGEYFLTPGPHKLVGVVPTFARTAAEFHVLGDSSNVGPFVLEGGVTPDPAEPGEPVEFRLRVSNISNTEATFGVDGCPVHYTIDGVYSPDWACAEFWRLITLQPGDSHLFSAADDERLIHDPAAYPLSPGPHVVTLTVPDIGSTRVPFRVSGSPPHLTVLRGTVYANRTDSAGAADPAAGAVVRAVPSMNAPGDSAFRFAGNDPSAGFVAVTGDDGVFEIPVPAGTYRLVAGGLRGLTYRYWPGANTWDDAGIIPACPTCPEAYYVLFLDPVDDPQPAVISGVVLGYDPVTDGPPDPLADATVRGVSLLGFERVLYGGGTGEDGTYAFEVPAKGPYLVTAFAPGYPTMYYPTSSSPDFASGVDVRSGATTEGVDFVLQPQGASGAGSIEGYVYEDLPDPDCDIPEGCLHPSVGTPVRISAAFPTFAPYEIVTHTDHRGRYFVDGLITDADGFLSYYVAVEKPGFPPLYYPGGVPFDRAEPLPVYPNRVADAGRITIGGGPSHEGFLTGRVMDPGGVGIPGALVRGYLDPENPDGEVLSARTDGDGYFTLKGLRPLQPVLLSAEAEGFIPEYYPDAHRWTMGEPVPAAGPYMRIVVPVIELGPALHGGPYIQAGRVSVEPVDGVPDDSVAAPGVMRSAAELRALAYHAANVSHAFFYLVSSETAGPLPLVLAGDRTGDNGAVILTGLPAGVYFAYADRPGYETADFTSAAGGSVPLTLGPNTPAVLADIRLRSLRPPPGTETFGHPMVEDLANAPNPFRPLTTITYRLMDTGPVTVQIFDYQGRLVRTLVQTNQDAGFQSVPWDATDASGRRVRSGMYFYRVQAAGRTYAKKMVLLP